MPSDDDELAVFVPTGDEIQEGAAIARSSWTPATRWKRLVTKERPLEIRVVPVEGIEGAED